MNLAEFLFFLPVITNISSLPFQKHNFTIQLCCQTWEYFNMTHYKCETIPYDANIKWNLKIKYPNETEKEINIFKNAIHKVQLPCEKPEAMHWQMNETINMDVVNNVEFCFAPYPLKGSNKYALVQFDCHLELHYFLAFKHEYIYFLSGFLHIPTLIIYIMLKPLNKNLMGKCFICYLSSVLATNVFYFVIPQMLRIRYRLPNLIYILIGFTHFYLNMVIVYWLNILGFDAWKNFSDSNVELDAYEKKKRFRFYSIYVWTISAITTVPTVWRNFSDILEYCGKYERSKSCVMLTYLILYTDIYFAPVVMLILVINFLIFCCVSWKIYTYRRNVATTMYNEGLLREKGADCKINDYTYETKAQFSTSYLNTYLVNFYLKLSCI